MATFGISGGFKNIYTLTPTNTSVSFNTVYTVPVGRFAIVVIGFDASSNWQIAMPGGNIVPFVGTGPNASDSFLRRLVGGYNGPVFNNTGVVTGQSGNGPFIMYQNEALYMYTAFTPSVIQVLEY